MTDWKQTPTLDAFAAMYDEDEHLWWRIGCGHHQNLYEAAVERYEQAEAKIQRVLEVHHSKLDRHPQGDVQRCIACLDLWPCPTIRAIDGGAE